MMTKIQIKDTTPELIENSVKAAFGASQSASYYRFDFMYAFHQDNVPSSFTFCQEISNEYLWLGYGGTVPDARGFTTVKNFRDMLDDIAENYKYVGAQVKNDNFPMIKIYLAHEFKIVGLKQNNVGDIYLEFYKELKKEQLDG